MQHRVDLITLGVPDLAAARRFYLEGLGWEAILGIPDRIVFIQAGPGQAIALFGAGDLAADVGEAAPSGPPVGTTFTLAQVVATEDDARTTVERALAAGARLLKAPQYADFGGYRAYFADPAGVRWEIATNPGWSVAADGRVSIGPVAGE